MTPASLHSSPLCVSASLRENNDLTQSRKAAKKTRLMQDLLTGKVSGKADAPEESNA